MKFGFFFANFVWMTKHQQSHVMKPENFFFLFTATVKEPWSIGIRFSMRIPNLNAPFLKECWKKYWKKFRTAKNVEHTKNFIKIEIPSTGKIRFLHQKLLMKTAHRPNATRTSERTPKTVPCYSVCVWRAPRRIHDIDNWVESVRDKFGCLPKCA